MKEKGILALGVILLALSPSPSMGQNEVVVEQVADPPCPDDSGNIYVDCGNGTVTDNRTGLVWLKDANCFGKVGWRKALARVADLSDLPAGSESLESNPTADCGLSDGSSPGEWHLPDNTEWNAMIANALAQGSDPDCIATSPIITNDLGNRCWVTGSSSFTGVQSSMYWHCGFSLYDWLGNALPEPQGGGIYLEGRKKSRKIGRGIFSHGFQKEGYVWPVRGGQCRTWEAFHALGGARVPSTF